jgi:hypothetical protein
MFSFTTGKAAYPQIYQTKMKDIPTTAPNAETYSSEESMGPAIDGPPSPERIRAYTEQMKRSSIFGNNSRSNTFSSSSPSSSFRSSSYASTEALSLSRKSSGRSTKSRMTLSRSERPDSTQIFGSIFSRGGRKLRRGNSIIDGIAEEGNARDHYYGRASGSRRGIHTKGRHHISAPYNFQHVTHTHRENMPNLHTSPRELQSEFSALRASQLPTHGELKGIRAQDLHFENFSSEALNVLAEEEEHAPSTSSLSKVMHRKSSRSLSVQRTVPHTKSHDNLRAAPPRPPRSPLSPKCPIELPVRTSSRTASVLFDTFDPLATTTVDRPQTSGGFRRPTPFSLPTPSPESAIWNASQEGLPETDESMSHALTTPGDEAWPLTASLNGSFGFELPDVQEEEEAGPRNSRTSFELRASKSSPALRNEALAQAEEPFDMKLSSTLVQTQMKAGPPLSPGFRFEDESWEQDIDYCYEHEIEADCDYQWDRCSMEESTVVEGPPLALHLEDDDRSVYHGRFRPSLLIPSAFDVPELSPMSNMSANSSNPRTPQNFGCVRSPSQASSFKESHGFTLSPTLLIPSDFQAQMDQETYAAYNGHFGKDSTSATIIDPESFRAPNSPIDEASSSVVSYRSSNFSRGSARSSSSTRLSSATSRFSGDAYRSISSSSSLPDLIASGLSKQELTQEHEDEIVNISELLFTDSEPVKVEQLSLAADPTPIQTESKISSQSLLTVKTPEIGGVNGKACLSPVAEVHSEEQISARAQLHGRKISAPVTSQTMKEFMSRPRAGTYNTTASLIGGKKRGSYMLFPQT